MQYLVIYSIVDTGSMTSNIVEMSAKTINFTSFEASCIYLDEDSI